MAALNPARLLRNHRVAHVTNTESLQAYQVGACGGGQFRRRVAGDSAFRVQLRQASLGRIDIALLWSPGEMTVESNLDAGYPFLLQFPLMQTLDIELDGRQYHVAPGSAIVMSPPVSARRRCSRGWTLALALDRALVRSRLAARLGHAATGLVAFSPLITTAAAELLDFCLLLIEAVDRGRATPGRSMTTVLENGLVDLLLEIQPHTHTSAAMLARASSAMSRLERIEQHLHANINERLTIGGMARVAGCSVRSLQALMVEQTGMGPAEFVRRHRLLRARSLLQQRDLQCAIAQVAQQSGFSHFGHFTSNYRRLFGETPSETRRRSQTATGVLSRKRSNNRAHGSGVGRSLR